MEKVTACPAFRLVAVDGAIVALSAELTVTSPEFIEFAEVGVVALSVTRTFALSVFPTRFELEAKMNDVDVPTLDAMIVFVTELKTMKL